MKAKDLRLHLINVAVPSFLNPSSGLQGVLKVEPLLQYKAEDEATGSQPATKEEEEEKEEVAEVLDFEDDFEVFNQPQSLEAPASDFGHLPSTQVSQTQGDSSIPEAMGLQRRTRSSFRDLMESQVGGNALEKATQAKLPPLRPLNLFDLTLLTTRGRGIRKALKWWKEGSAPYQRRSSPRRELSRPG